MARICVAAEKITFVHTRLDELFHVSELVLTKGPLVIARLVIDIHASMRVDACAAVLTITNKNRIESSFFIRVRLLERGAIRHRQRLVAA